MIFNTYYQERSIVDNFPPDTEGCDVNFRVLPVIPVAFGHPFRGSEGQRYSVTRIYGRPDHYWEGVRSYTNLASVEHFREFIGSISAEQRELFRFPLAGDSYYNAVTLGGAGGALPGWNARGGGGGEYA